MGWTTPDGEDPRKFWKFVQGKDNHFVRAVFECRPAKDTWSGTSRSPAKPLTSVLRIADFITIKLEGLATRIGQSAVAPFQGCLDAAQPPAAVGGAPPSGIAALPDLPLRSRSAVATPDHWHGGRSELMAAGGGVAAEESAEKALMARLPEAAPGFEAVEADDGSAPPALLPYPKLPRKRSRPAWYPVRSWPTPHRIPLMPSPRSFSTAHSAPSSSASTISAPIT